ncbi:MFS transporter [Lutibaculum baratangense]|uniref:Putative transport transmembrane protein n=1 Tax=Lutibaculum baratangense AMV1 TaxID=631454 RepID=V4T8N1_9HYPH|nr:MFS transporter [Lutibaculum baratangense]ESR22898.1 putative transport transmembrane protein [Lutibaculum baratangense AMV1]
MRSAIASIAALMISVLILLTGSGLQSTLIPLAAANFGFDTIFVGLIGSSYFLGMAVGCLVAPRFIRRTGHIRAFGAVTAVTTAAAVLHALVIEPITWNILRCITGFCYAAAYAIIESWLNDKSDNTIRGQILAFYNLITFAGMAAGQQFLGLYPTTGFELFAISAVLISLAALPVALTASASPPIPESPEIRVRWLLKLSPVAAAGVLTVGLANGTFWTLGPVYATALGLGAAGVGTFVTASILGAVVALWPAGRLSDRIDRRIVILLCCAAAAIAGIGLAFFAGDSRLALYGFAFLFGAGAMPIYSLCSAHAADFATPREMVQVSTGLLLVYTLGAITGPFAAGFLIRELPVGTIFVLTAVAHLAMFAFTIVRLNRREAPPPEEREPFVAVPRTSPGITELDPRAVTLSDLEADTVVIEPEAAPAEPEPIAAVIEEPPPHPATVEVEAFLPEAQPEITPTEDKEWASP